MKIIEPSIEVLDNIDGQPILKKIERIGRVCYKSENNITDDSAERFIKNIIKNGHESVLEHASVSVRVICDRGVSHEIVRHRVASYSQESTRYNNYSKDKYGSELTFIKPVWIDVPLEILNMINPKFLMKALDMGGKLNGIAEDEFMWISTMDAIECMYFSLLKKGWAPEQACSILPNSLKTEIVMTMNLREWRHFLKLRTDRASHPQMREIANMILDEFKSKIPVVFDDIEESEII